jgi:hypothetical protein
MHHEAAAQAALKLRKAILFQFAHQIQSFPRRSFAGIVFPAPHIKLPGCNSAPVRGATAPHSYKFAISQDHRTPKH